MVASSSFFAVNVRLASTFTSLARTDASTPRLVVKMTFWPSSVQAPLVSIGSPEVSTNQSPRAAPATAKTTPIAMVAARRFDPAAMVTVRSAFIVVASVPSLCGWSNASSV